MALSGSAYTAFARHRLIIEWSASQSIPNNNSSVTARVYLQSMDAYGAMYAPAMNSGSITVNGSTHNFSANSNLSAYQKKLLASHTFNVPHNNDGGKDFRFSVTYNINVTFAGVFYGNRTASGVSILNTIPRASSVSVSSGTVNLGSAVTINVNRASTGFTHTLIYRNGNYSKTIVSKSTSGSVSYTPENAIANQFTTATSKAGTITCETYNGNTRIGTTSVGLTVRTQANGTYNPTISSVRLSEDNGRVTSAFGSLYLQDISRIRVQTSISTKYNAGVADVSVSIGGSSSSGANAVIGSIKQTGAVPVRVTVKDTRGYTVTHSQNITILPYQNPAITLFTANRRENAQEIVDFTWRGTTKPVNTANTMGYELAWKKTNVTSWTVLASGSNATSTTWNSSKTVSNADVGATYDVRFRLYDKLMTVESTAQISTATVPMSWGTNGVAIGKVFEEGKETFQVRGSGYYEGLLTTAPDVYARDGGSLNLNNSDIVGINGLYIGRTSGITDPADNDGEGLLFPHSSTIIPSDGKIDRSSGWDTFRIMDGVGYLNSRPVMSIGDQPMWTGALYMNGSHVITLPKNIKDAPHGWALMWGEYNVGVGVNPWNFNVSLIHKDTDMSQAGGTGHVMLGKDKVFAMKYIHLQGNGTRLKGNDDNQRGTSNTVVLRAVYEW